MGRTKIAVSLRMDPDVLDLAKRRAKEERRSFAGHLEWLVLRDAEAKTTAPEGVAPGKGAAE